MNHNIQSINIVADDLTGAADTGVQFYPYFKKTILVSFRHLSGYDKNTPSAWSQATVLYTNSRALNAEAARKRLNSVANRISRSERVWVYKKIDSCLRGNLGAEIEALMDSLEYDLSFVAPAFPEMGRTTKDDIHLVKGIPLASSEMARDPVTPATESRLSRVIQSQSRYPVGHLSLPILEGKDAGLQAELEDMIRQGIRHIVFDAVSRSHLDRIAQLFISSQSRILPVGSAGLAGSISGHLPVISVEKKQRQNLPHTSKNLFVCGSISETTRKQVKTLTATYPYTEIALDPEELADPAREETIIGKASSVRSTMLKNNVIVKIDSPQIIDKLINIEGSRVETVNTIVRSLGKFVGSLLTGVRPELLFITGGDTADAVFTAVNAGGMEIHGEILPGVVKGTLFDGPLDGLAVVTKAGAFGQKNTLVVLHEAWQKRQSRENSSTT